MYLGFDPGRDKCGLAIVGEDRQVICHEVIAANYAIEQVREWLQEYDVDALIMGDQTASKTWQAELQQNFPRLPIHKVDERYSSLEARDRYWQMYPAKGLMGLLPKGMRQPPRPIDDIVAILLVERYLTSLDNY
jgi:RNase H-fold protein (predicted Holliday junction resolvase)